MRRCFALALVAGCLPEAPPPWQVDHTIVVALGTEVVARGPWGSEPLRADRGVAELMPGDTFRPAPFMIGPDGPVELAPLRPRYFYCTPQTCIADVARAGGVRDCDDEESVPPASTCELRGGTLKLGAMRTLLQVSSIFMVSATGEGPSTNECMRRFRGVDTDSEVLRECVLRLELMQFGPTWRLLLLAAATGLADAVPLIGITPAVTAAEPDLYPGEPPLALEIVEEGASRSLTVNGGSTVKARRGATVTATAQVDPEDAQQYWFVDGAGGFSPGIEALTIGWLFSEYVDWTAPDLLTVEWTLPDRPGPFYLFALLGDGDAITPTWLRFEIEGP